MTQNRAQKVLVVEDEIKMAMLISEYLKKSGFKTAVLDNGLSVVDWVKAHNPDLILLDLMLPGMSGIEVCKEIRKFSEVPIVMLTARIEEIDRVLGLELGADDYICKPFSPPEVVARIKNVLRRTQSMFKPELKHFVVDDAKQKVFVNNVALSLTTVEFRLFKLMFADPGKIFSRDQLMNNIYDDHRIVRDRTIDSHVNNVRKKIIAASPEDDVIDSVYGMGYKFDKAV